MLVADLRAPEAVEPGERPFDHPPITSLTLLGFDTTAGDTGADAALVQRQTEVTVVLTLIGMKLVRSATRSIAHLGLKALNHRMVAKLLFRFCSHLSKYGST